MGVFGFGRCFVVAAALLAPTVADAGFLEDLFGQRPQPQPQPQVQPQAYAPMAPAPGVAVPHLRRRPAAPRAETEISGRAVATCCKAGESPVSALLADPTLRAGDAVMLPTGIRVFGGGSGSRHTPRDFVALGSFRYATKRMAELSQIDRVSAPAPFSPPTLTIRRKDVAVNEPAPADAARVVRTIAP